MRTFLRGVVVVAGILLVACGRQGGTPVPSPTAMARTTLPATGTPTPTVGSTVAPTMAVASTLVATVAATTTSTATAAPVPAATATQVAAPAAPQGTATYEIVSGQSRARYIVNEQFTNLPTPNDAVGETSKVTGRLVFDANGLPAPGSAITVDMRSLASDRPPRDQYLRGNSIESDTFPTATFVVTGAEGMHTPLAATPTAFRLSGSMTLHGVTRPLTWETTASADGDTITGTATASFKMDEFGIAPPKIAVLTTSDVVRLEMKLVLVRKAA